jgi:AraC-like DNA-binding protein
VLGLAALALREPLTHARLPAPEAAAEPEAAPPEPPKYGERALPSDTRSDYLARLQRCMDEEQPWRDGELLLDDLAARLALTPKELSQLVNDAHGAQFQDFLNRHRVAELQRLLRDPARAGQSILALGLEADFNSKSALNRAFKRHARFTPSE